MVYLLYNFLLLISALFLVPYYLLRGLRYGKSRRGIRERLGCYSPQQLSALRAKKNVWIHAVSVGETRAAMPLIKQMRLRYPDLQIVVSNVTETGHAIALEDKDIDLCLFFPFDFSWAVRKALHMVRPELIIIVETEIWPNFTREAHLMKVPLILVNGRISDRSFPRYRFARFLLRPILDRFTAFCMQSQTDAERIMTLGAPDGRVENTGNLKFDHDLTEITPEQVQQRKKHYILPDKTAIFVAGSTHEGEEKFLLEAYKKISSQIERDLILVLIPRHPERKREVQLLLKEFGVKYRLRSSLSEGDDLLVPGEVLLVDTLGEVLKLYSVADLIFVGGSLVSVGGHNLLEAALMSKPVLFGPHIHNFKEISAKLIRSGAGVKVANPQELVRQSVIMLNDPVRCCAMGEAGRSLIAENAGTTERTMRHISKALL
ncbi:3-deoxy-D-manno-octulosonic-acid transferase [Desulfuromusa kysingii]|uniref:3-deoxy-D-manno-octulosonic acid transferase n=1 Tax=Desulfuromusa kysingii TaxID=37625 RepID=A0A1H3YFL0_9BACT|nr:3-deoxy-D-manno-octulosonic acid transferase [Desulfuromusa kysingii]SEA10327.1 3-deoxy-D-manno-octulosonic-acid transferase [Desulfuromusa kysingii]